MPIYEYECVNCGNQFEELVFGTDKPCCPQCGEDDCHRLLSVFSGGEGSGDSGGSDFTPAPSAGCGSGGFT